MRSPSAFPLILACGLMSCSSGKSDNSGETFDAAQAIDASLPQPDAETSTQLQEMRGILHVHSPYSHDACDGEGLNGSTPNAPCLAQLRAALCDTGLDFAMLTDHPSHMEEYPFEKLVLFNAASDELVRIDGDVVANRLGCPSGHKVLITVGYEGSPHLMPLGLRHHVAEEHYAGLSNSKGLADAQAHIAALEAAGAVTSMAHSEEDDVSDQLIIDSGLDSMEWYNVHGNLLMFLGGDSLAGSATELLPILEPLGRFAGGSGSGAHPDLVNLLFLQTFPEEGLAKWRRVQKARPITGVLGSDVHRNVSVDPICDDDNPIVQAACVAGAESVLPDSLHFIITGGALLLSDGDRVDSYARVMRWLDNRLLVPDNSYESLMQAFKEGRNYGVYSVLGDPDGFAFSANALDVGKAEIGGSIAGPVELTLSLPQPTPTTGGAPFTTEDANKAELRVVVVRTTSTGSTNVHDQVVSEDVKLSVSDPGQYHVEIWVTPHHLDAALGTEVALADHQYLWIISNSIEVL